MNDRTYAKQKNKESVFSMFLRLSKQELVLMRILIIVFIVFIVVVIVFIVVVIIIAFVIAALHHHLGNDPDVHVAKRSELLDAHSAGGCEREQVAHSADCNGLGCLGCNHVRQGGAGGRGTRYWWLCKTQWWWWL
jgi:hypothetical protein